MIESIDPWISNDADLQRVKKLVRALVGITILSVGYAAPSGMNGWGHEGSAVDEIHKGVLFGVSTRSSTETIYISWFMQGASEGLQVLIDGPVLGNSRIDTFDVSGGARWSAFVGEQVTGAGVSIHEPDEHSPRAIWSLRLRFASGRSVCLALGQLETDETLMYSPDTIVAIFLPEVAKQYFIPASISSAWGEDA